MDQLDQCRNAGFINKFLGGCNDMKHNLNMCLRQEVGVYVII